MAVPDRRLRIKLVGEAAYTPPAREAITLFPSQSGYSGEVELPLQWRVLGQREAELPLQWRVVSQAEGEILLRWGLNTQRIYVELPLRWRLLRRAGKTHRLSWRLLAYREAELEITYPLVGVGPTNAE